MAYLGLEYLAYIQLLAGFKAQLKLVSKFEPYYDSPSND